MYTGVYYFECYHCNICQEIFQGYTASNKQGLINCLVLNLFDTNRNKVKLSSKINGTNKAMCEEMSVGEYGIFSATTGVNRENTLLQLKAKEIGSLSLQM